MGDQDIIENVSLNLIEKMIRNGVPKKNKKATLKRIRSLAIKAKIEVHSFRSQCAISHIIDACDLLKTGKAIKHIKNNIHEAINSNVSPSTMSG